MLVHIDRIGLTEFKTIKAMEIRIAVTIAFALIAYYKIENMKIFHKILIVAGLILVMSSFQPFQKETAYSLTVKVEDLRNSKGVVQFTLYNKDGTIPDEKFENYYQMETSKIHNGSATISFLELPEGNYAINILHDENHNGKIDKKFMLPLPKEGIGFSNYESIGLTNRPNFSKASFQLIKDSTKHIKIIYF